MQSFATTSLQVGLDAKQMETGLDKIPATIDSKLPDGAVLSGKGKDMGGMLSAGLVGGLAGGIAGALTTALTGALSSALGAAEEMVKSAINHIQELGSTTDFASALGYSSESLSRVQGITEKAGVNTEQAIKSLAKLDEVARKAVMGDEDSVSQFEKLGIDAKEFMALDLDKKLMSIADSLKADGDKIEKNITLMDIFGEKAGVKLIGVLSKSSEELEKLQGHGGKTAEELTKLATASASIDDVMGQLEDTLDAVFIQLAPFIESAGDLAMEILPAITDAVNEFGPVAGEIFKELVKFGADLYDIWISLEGGVETLQLKFEMLIEFIKAQVQPVLEAVKWVADQLRGDEGSSREKVDNLFARLAEKREAREKEITKRLHDNEMARAKSLEIAKMKGVENAAKKAAEEAEKQAEKEKKLAEEIAKWEREQAQERLKFYEEQIKNLENAIKQFEAEQKHIRQAITPIFAGSVDAAKMNAAPMGSGLTDNLLRQQLGVANQHLEQLKLLVAKEQIKIKEH